VESRGDFPLTSEYAYYEPFAATSAAEVSKLQVRFWGNISFGPTDNVFWYQDQSHKPGSWLLPAGQTGKSMGYQ